MDSSVRLGDQRVCAVCARVLDRHTDTRDGPVIKWEHALQDQPADHPPIPVRPEDIHAQYRCDFCNEDATTPGWVVPAKDFEMPGGSAFGMSDGDWGACEACVKLIEADDWTDLIARVVSGKGNQGDAPDDVVAVHLARIYHRLRANMTGPPRKVQGGM